MAAPYASTPIGVSPPASASASKFDFDADRASLIDQAKTELGAKASIEVVSDVFVFVAPDGGSVKPAVSFASKALGAYFHDRFDTRPPRAILVYLFANAEPYERYCQKTWGAACISPYGFYAASERRMVMNVGLGIGTLTHELVHPILETDFPGAPTWIDEGIASLFEAPVFGAPLEIHGNKNWRHPKLLAALHSSTDAKKARLTHLLAITDAAFRGPDEKLNYATARYFCQFLDERGELWPFYHRYRDGFATDPTGEKALRAVTGKTPDELQPAFEAWVKSL